MKFASERRMNEGFIPLLIEHPDDPDLPHPEEALLIPQRVGDHEDGATHTPHPRNHRWLAFD